jgi:dihydrofolate reductase
LPEENGLVRKLIVSNIASLDGFFAGPQKEIDWFHVDAEFLEYSRQMLDNAGALLFGAVTYQLMADFWPSSNDVNADRMNNLEKFVVSSTLKTVSWNNSHLLKGDIQKEVTRLKSLPGKDLVLLGSARLASFLLQKNLVDEYRVILQPVLLGSGSPLFPDITHRLPMKHLTTWVFNSGGVLLSYQLA